jgi:hypothetical protein
MEADRQWREDQGVRESVGGEQVVVASEKPAAALDLVRAFCGLWSAGTPPGCGQRGPLLT